MADAALEISTSCQWNSGYVAAGFAELPAKNTVVIY